MFQRFDIILVICHMYLRSKSFQSAYLKCMLGSSLQGLSRGEALSKVTEADIIRIAKHSRNDMVQDRGTIASELFHSITASCKTFDTVMNRPKKHEQSCFPCGARLGHLLFFLLYHLEMNAVFRLNCALTSNCNCCHKLEWKKMK